MSHELVFLHHEPDSEHINHDACFFIVLWNRPCTGSTVQVPFQSPPKEGFWFFLFIWVATVTGTSWEKT